MKGIYFWICLTFYCLISSAQESVPKKLYRLKPERQLTNFFNLDAIQQTKPNVNYELIRSQGKWYAVGNGDGQVFTPDNGIWKRVDKTRLEGYHYGAFLFDCNGTLMKYGGYGFWRNHGMFVCFNENIGDWQIKTSDRDIPFNGNLAFFNRKENALYSFGNFIYNQSMSEEKKFLDSLYRIDLLKMKWENLGKINYTLLDKFHLHYRLHSLPNTNGCFVLPISTDSSALYFNFETLKYGIYNSKNNPILFRFFRDLPDNQQLYSDTYGLKILACDSLVNIDSIPWEIALDQPVESSNLIEQPAQTVAIKYPLLMGAIGFVFGIILLFYFFKRKKTLLNHVPNSKIASTPHTLDLSVSNTLIFKGAMYQIDSTDYVAICKFILQDASTIELNDWLSLENKQPENQKKQRAEWIKRMNAFFYAIGFKEEAFYRERLETDKRMFVYKMNIKLKPNPPLEDSHAKI